MATKRSIAIREAAALDRIAGALGVSVDDLSPGARDADIARMRTIEAIAELVEEQAQQKKAPTSKRAKAAK